MKSGIVITDQVGKKDYCVTVFHSKEIEKFGEKDWNSIPTDEEGTTDGGVVMSTTLPCKERYHHDNATSETLIEEAIGCGPFQGLIILLVTILTKVPTAATFMFMSFGNYNPGWTCLHSNAHDNDTVSNTTNGSALKQLHYGHGTCEEFDACSEIRFNPDSVTIVSEWGLLCRKSWIASLIISIQMAGALIGSVIAGQMGDSFGRKTVVYGCLASMGVLNLISVFSVSWQMFAVVRFFLGAAASSLLALYYVLTNECLPYKWRGPNNAIPAWNIGTILFGILAFVFRDWKILHVCVSILCFLCFIPVFWVPESLRWLAVKKKNKRYIRVFNKMARMNKKPLPSETVLNKIVSNVSKQEEGSKGYSVLHLLHPGYRKYTIIFSLIWMCMSVIYYAISFGVTNLYGDFYLNLILLFALEMPFAVFPSFVPNLLGRVKGSVVFVFMAVLCLITCAGLDAWGDTAAKVAGSIIILLVKVTLNSGWCIHIMQVTEIYPTVIRGLSVGWGCLMARVGGILAPFILPNGKGDDNLYISYVAMAVVALLICGGIIQLPETKGKPLRDSLEDGDDDDDDDGVDDDVDDKGEDIDDGGGHVENGHVEYRNISLTDKKMGQVI